MLSLLWTMHTNCLTLHFFTILIKERMVQVMFLFVFFIRNSCLIYTMSHPLNCENCLCSMLLVVFDVIINTESNTAYIVQVYSAMR